MMECCAGIADDEFAIRYPAVCTNGRAQRIKLRSDLTERCQWTADHLFARNSEQCGAGGIEFEQNAVHIHLVVHVLDVLENTTVTALGIADQLKTVFDA